MIDPEPSRALGEQTDVMLDLRASIHAREQAVIDSHLYQGPATAQALTDTRSELDASLEAVAAALSGAQAERDAIRSESAARMLLHMRDLHEQNDRVEHGGDSLAERVRRIEGFGRHAYPGMGYDDYVALVVELGTALSEAQAERDAQYARAEDATATLIETGRTLGELTAALSTKDAEIARLTAGLRELRETAVSQVTATAIDDLLTQPSETDHAR